MIEVLYFSDKRVKPQLFARVTGAKKLTLVTVVPPHKAAKHPAALEPFASLEREHGQRLDQVLVVDQGTVEGMWRDPVVDLADALHPADSKAAYAAATGYFFVEGGRARATVKKRGDAEQDGWFLREALSRLDDSVPPPPPRARRSAPRREARRVSEAEETLEDPRPGPRSAQVAAEDDPFTVLGITRGATLVEAKRAWKALLVQYHPDKVAHLAPEFRALAETKTRALMKAWEDVQLALRGGD